MQKSIGRSEFTTLQRLLRESRKAANLSQRELAQRLHTSPSRIADYETGDRRMDLIQLGDYVAALGLSLPAFVQAFDDAVNANEQAIPDAVMERTAP